MLMKKISRCLKAGIVVKRGIATTASCLHRVAVIGSAGGVGKALVMLLKANHRITDMSLMDLQNTNGIAADISHIDTFSGVKPFTGADKLEDSLRCANMIVVSGGVASTGDAKRSALFDANKDFIYNLCMAKAKVCPEAFLVIVTNPINAMIPLAAETLKLANAYDAKKLFGISKLDTVRAKTFIGDNLVYDPAKVHVHVIGGHSATSIVPVFSSARPPPKGDMDELKPLYNRVRNAGGEVLKAKGGKETAQLSTAYATATFCDSLLQAMDGKPGVTDVAFVESKVVPDVTFFSSTFELNKDGIKRFEELPDMNNYEKELLQKALPELKQSIQQGIQYAQSKKKN